MDIWLVLTELNFSDPNVDIGCEAENCQNGLLAAVRYNCECTPD